MKLSHLLRETAEAHHLAEKRLPPHDWADWYAAYMSARQLDGGANKAPTASAEYAATFADNHIRDMIGGGGK